MAADLTPTADTALIEAYFKTLAPKIDALSCGTKLDGGFQVTFRLNPSSVVKFMDISKTEFDDADKCRELIENALHEVNV